MTQMLRPPYSTHDWEEMRQALLNGKPVGLPTETVYGLGARIDDPKAIDAIFQAKGRPKSDPLIVHVPADGACYDSFEKKGWVAPQDTTLQRRFDELVQAFWPGPLTLVVPKGANISPELTAGGSTVALRSPDHEVFQRLLKEIQVPLAAPSANRFGRISPTTADAVLEELDGRIEWIVDGGPCPVGLESTVLRLHPSGSAEVLRPGLFSFEDLRARVPQLTLQKQSPPSTLKAAPLSSPGLLESHYAPLTRVLPLESLSLQKISFSKPVALLSWSKAQLAQDSALLSKLQIPHEAHALTPTGDAYLAAQTWYHLLRELDHHSVDAIIVGTLPSPTSGVLQALHDRLRRAAAPRT